MRILCTTKEGADSFFSATKNSFKSFKRLNISENSSDLIKVINKCSSLDIFDKKSLIEFQYFCHIRNYNDDKELEYVANNANEEFCVGTIFEKIHKDNVQHEKERKEKIDQDNERREKEAREREAREHAKRYDSKLDSILEKLTESIANSKADAYKGNNELHSILKTLTTSVITLDEKSKTKEEKKTKEFALVKDIEDVDTTDIDGKSFMHNVKIPLTDKGYFLTWYQQLQMQSDAYNIKIRPLNQIQKLKHDAKLISACEHMKKSVEIKIGQLLINKFAETDIIKDSFKEGQKTLEICNNGFEFLDTFLRELHPKFSTSSVATENIPKFSDYNDLYAYCRGMNDYYFRLELDGVIYNKAQISNSFLARLDSDSYSSARIQALQNLKTYNLMDDKYKKIPPSSYQLLNLPGTILNLQKETTATTLTASTPTNPYRHSTNFPARVNLINSSATHVSTITCSDPNYQENTSTNNDNDQIETEIDPFVNYIRNNNNRQQQKQRKFNRRCRACGLENHHAKDCRFLKKVQQCLAFLNFYPNSARDNKKKFMQKGTYIQRRGVVNSLIAENFIPYDNVDPDIFIDEIENKNDFEKRE